MNAIPFRINPNLGGKKIGIILPSVNCVTEPEFYAVAPKHLSFHTTRLFLNATTPESLLKMGEGLDEAAKLMETVKPHAVAFACTSGSFIKGMGGDIEIANRLADIIGCPVVTTSTAMLQAMKALGIRKIALGTPYLDVVNEHEKSFLKENGFQVVSCEGLGLSGPVIREQVPQRAYDLALRVDVPEAESIVMSCTDFRVLEATEALEKRLSKPVLSSNQVTLWALLKLLGFTEKISGYGRLLSEMP